MVNTHYSATVCKKVSKKTLDSFVKNLRILFDKMLLSGRQIKYWHFSIEVFVQRPMVTQLNVV